MGEDITGKVNNKIRVRVKMIRVKSKRKKKFF
jgi:hypothetical protein